MGLKAWVADLLFRTRVIHLFAWGRGSRLTVFGYHRIQPDEREFSTPFCDEVYGPTVSEFEQQVLWLKRYTRILSESELLEILETGRSPTGLCTMITFDDGYRDNYTLAFPVLRRQRVPALFFIPSGLITERKLGWWDIIAWFVKKTRKPGLRLEALLETMILKPYEETRELLDRLARECEVPFPDAELQDSQIMSWDQIREVSREGIAIGSHSHSHRVLATLSEQIQAEELALSKSVIEREIGLPVRSIAYPVGGPKHFTPQTCQIARRAGYRAAFCFATGANRGSLANPWAIRRVSAPRTLPFLAAKVVFPQVFGRG